MGPSFLSTNVSVDVWLYFNQNNCRFEWFKMLTIISIFVLFSASSAFPTEKVRCNCVVEPHWAPVCGTDGRTYPNVELLECMKPCIQHGDLEVAHEGKCVKQDPKEASEMCLSTCSTSMDINPVCGTDGNTYVNNGALECQKKCYNEDLEVEYTGECQQTKIDSSECLANCEKTWEVQTICGSDGKTYLNKGRFECHQKCVDPTLEFDHFGMCQKTKMTSEECLGTCVTTMEIDPVCGTDGKTYVNSGRLSCHHKCVDDDLQIAHKGECKPKKSSFEQCLGSCAAIAIFAPVCGTDGNTYTNKGELGCHQRCGNSDLDVAYEGECKKVKVNTEVCLSTCETSFELDPVCGNDGTTYANPGTFQCQKKCINGDLQIAYMGECQTKKSMEDCLGQCAAIAIFAPVCGTDGNTYTNIGELNCHKKCGNSELDVAHEGSCKEKRDEPGICMDNCPTNAEYEPVCGSDGKTYFNYATLKCQRECDHSDLTMAYKGECSPKRSIEDCLDSCVAIAVFDPVCGTDGNTYTNTGELGCHKMCGNSDLTVDYMGQCKPPKMVDECLASCPATANLQPVCGSDGKTYDNMSILKCQKKCTNGNLQFDHEGEC